MKEKLRNKGFWISLVSAALDFLQAVGIKVDVPAVNEIVSALLTVLVVLGIVSNPSSGSGYADGTLTDGGKDESMTSENGKDNDAESAESSSYNGGGEK